MRGDGRDEGMTRGACVHACMVVHITNREEKRDKKNTTRTVGVWVHEGAVGFGLGHHLQPPLHQADGHPRLALACHLLMVWWVVRGLCGGRVVGWLLFFYDYVYTVYTYVHLYI